MTIEYYTKGQRFETNNCGEVEIISYKGHRCIGIRFLNTGYETVINASMLRKGSILDPYTRTTYSLGYLGEGEYSIKDNMDCYSVWVGMFQLSYALHLPGVAMGLRVHKSFHCFQSFSSWYYTQIGIDCKGWQLTRFVKSEDNQVFGPSHCAFVPKSINLILQPQKECVWLGTRVKKEKWTARYLQTTKTFETQRDAIKWRAKMVKQHAKDLITKYGDELDERVIERMEKKFRLKGD